MGRSGTGRDTGHYSASRTRTPGANIRLVDDQDAGYRDAPIVRVPSSDNHCPSCQKKRDTTKTNLQTVYDPQAKKNVWFDRNDLVSYKGSFLRRVFGTLVRINSLTGDRNGFVEKTNLSWASFVLEVSYLPAAGVWLAHVRDDDDGSLGWWMLTADQAVRWFYYSNLTVPQSLLDSVEYAMIKPRHDMIKPSRG